MDPEWPVVRVENAGENEIGMLGMLLLRLRSRWHVNYGCFHYWTSNGHANMVMQQRLEPMS
jgi:hypothetical protein